VIMEENKGYGSVIGSSSAPYVNALAGQYASASAWYGVWHPSLPNYLGIVSGSTQGVSSDCTGCGPFAGPSLGSQLTQAGIPWTAYMESMPSPCSIAGGSGNYAKKHNPFVYFSDVLANGCAAHDVPYPGAAAMVSALDGAGAPDFVWVTPNLTDDMHNGSVAQGDAWLQANLAPVLASPWFLDYESTVVVTMDEWSSDNTGVGTANPGGGHILTLVISHSSLGVGAYTSPGNHYGMLRTIEEAYGLPLLGGAGDPRNGDLTALFDR
ncbi:MAG: alkaline phosphatase family protein, partial [Candidatus Dormibacterales bacterium]